MFDKYLKDFHENIEGLRDFVGLIDPFLSEHRQKIEEEHSESLLPLHLAHLEFIEEDTEKKEKYSKKLKEVFDGEIEVKFTDNESEKDKEETEEKKDNEKGVTVKVKGDTSKIDAAFEILARTYHQKEILYRSSFINLLSTVEWFFAQILHYHYDKHPESAGIKKKTLTLEELKSFESIKDAENYLIDDKIEGILRSSFKDWLQTLKNELNLSLAYTNDFENELIEIYLRRNLLVHNGGVVNSIYLSKVSEFYKEKYNINDKLEISKEYLERAISLLHTVFTLISCELWKKLEPNNEDRCSLIMELGFDYLKRQMWDLSEISSTFLILDKKMPISSRTAAQLNFWLSKKNGGKYNDVSKEILDADFSDKSKLFQIALYSLREEEDLFFNLLPQVLKTEELNVESLLEFPIFESMRNLPKFEELKKTNDILKNYFDVLNN